MRSKDAEEAGAAGEAAWKSLEFHKAPCSSKTEFVVGFIFECWLLQHIIVIDKTPVDFNFQNMLRMFFWWYEMVYVEDNNNIWNGDSMLDYTM